MTAKKHAFVPFANEADVLTVGKLSFENRLDRITVSGDVDITSDRQGLAAARELHSLLADIVARLEAQELPERLPAPMVTSVANPFG